MLSNSSVETKSCFDSRHSCFLNSVFCLGYFRQRLVCRFRCSTFCYSNFEFLFQSRLKKISVVLPALEASLPPPDVLWAVLGFLLASLLGFSPPELPGRLDDLAVVVGSFYRAGNPGLGGLQVSEPPALRADEELGPLLAVEEVDGDPPPVPGQAGGGVLH